MTRKSRNKQLSDTPMVGVRLGELRPRVESACERLGVDISEFVRRAVEQDLESYRGTLAPRAIYWSVAVMFMQLAQAIAKLGIVSQESYLELKGAIAATNEQVRANFDRREWIAAVARYGDFPDLAKAERVLSLHAWESPVGGAPVAGQGEFLEAASRRGSSGRPFPPREGQRHNKKPQKGHKHEA